jgi:hypothetical protein
MEGDPVDDTLTCIVFDTEGDPIGLILSIGVFVIEGDPIGLVLSMRLFVIEGDPVDLIVNHDDIEGDAELDGDDTADCEVYALILSD